ncbi:hypothetical protein ACJX0J_020423, partial [Zea mays]
MVFFMGLHHNLSFDLFEILVKSMFYLHSRKNMSLMDISGLFSVSTIFLKSSIKVFLFFSQNFYTFIKFTSSVYYSIESIYNICSPDVSLGFRPCICTTTLLIGSHYDFMFFIVFSLNYLFVHDVFMFLLFNLVIMFTNVGVEGKRIL